VTRYNGPGRAKGGDLLAKWRDLRAGGLLGRVFDRDKLDAWEEQGGKPPLSWVILGLAFVALMLGCAVLVALGPSALPRVMGAILMVGAYLFYIGRASLSMIGARRAVRQAREETEAMAQETDDAFRHIQETLDQIGKMADDIQTGRGGIDELYREVEETRRGMAENESELAAVKAAFERVTAKRPPSPGGPGGWAAVFEWQAAQQPRVTDKRLGELLGYAERTITTERYRLRHPANKCLPEST